MTNILNDEMLSSKNTEDSLESCIKNINTVVDELAPLKKVFLRGNHKDFVR